MTDKSNYIKAQAFDSDTHFHGKYPKKGKTDTSTGTTGKPTSWVRSHKELETVKKSLQLAAKIQFGDRRLNYINAFALGPWATGLTTYELMRNTGSVFATGPDKEKIYEQVLEIAKAEDHQLDMALDKLLAKHPRLNDYRFEIRQLLQESLQSALSDKQVKIAECIKAKSQALPEPIKRYRSQITAIAKDLNQEKSQILIAGYPPFLKDLANYFKEKGKNMADYSTIGIVGGQAISEAMRDVLIRDGFGHIYSSYGASDLDINLGVEGDDEIFIRKAIENNPQLARELYGHNQGLPMVFHYDPFNYHVECLDGSEGEKAEKDALIFTCTRNDRSSPRIRYDLGDKGRVYASSDVQALLAKHGIFHKPKTNLPLMLVWGRDSTVVFRGANLAFTELERAVTKVDEDDSVLKKAFYSYKDEDGAEQLEIWLELNEECDFPVDLEEYARHLINTLGELNQDFLWQLQQLDDAAPLPRVRFFKRHHSPISEAGGQRKQVLVFKNENLPENFEFPGEEECQDVQICRQNLSRASSNIRL